MTGPIATGPTGPVGIGYALTSPTTLRINAQYPAVPYQQQYTMATNLLNTGSGFKAGNIIKLYYNSNLVTNPVWVVGQIISYIGTALTFLYINRNTDINVALTPGVGLGDSDNNWIINLSGENGPTGWTGTT
jgi:hypothetical protein